MDTESFLQRVLASSELISAITGVLIAVYAVFFARIMYRRILSVKIGGLEVAAGNDEPDTSLTKLARERAFRREAEDNEGDAPLEQSPEERRYSLLDGYHAQGLAQSKISFWVSLMFAALGFLVIVGGVLTMDRSAPVTQQGTSFVTLIAGVIIDAVAALFFVQSNKARELMVAFFDKLRADRKFEESLRLVDAIADPVLRSRVQAVLAMNFAEIAAPDDQLRVLFEVQSPAPLLNTAPPVVPLHVEVVTPAS